MFSKIKRTINTIFEIKNKLETIQVALGRIENRQLKNNTQREYKVFSQWGEDGIIQYLINNIDIRKDVFVEFGVENYTESNTRFLLINNNWSGLVIDGDEKNINYIKKDDIYWRYNLKAECSFITAENINEILIRNGIKNEIGILSVDIDGNDFWVWKAITCISPAIVICEYNHRFGKDRAVTVPYDAGFVRNKKHYSNIYYGASIKALVLLAEKKGYKLVAGNSSGNNIFFVRNDLLNNVIQEKKIDEVFHHGKFREARDSNGNLTFCSLEREISIINELELIEINDKNF